MPDTSHMNLGTKVRVKADFRVGPTYLDPTTVTVKIKKPGSAAVSYLYDTDEEVIKTGVGKYYVEVLLDTTGTWYWSVESTGTGAIVDQGQIVVEPSYLT